MYTYIIIFFKIYKDIFYFDSINNYILTLIEKK